MIYTIKRVSVSDTNKDGNKLYDKNKKPYLKVGLQVAEHGEAWINGLFFAPTCPWKEGDKVELEIKKELYNGKESLKWELPRKENKFEKIENDITALKLRVTTLEQGHPPQYPQGDPEEVKF